MATTHTAGATETPADTKALRNYVGGEWITPQTAEYLDVTNPATGDLLGRVPLSNRADVEQAVAAAQAAFPAWRATPPLDRARYLFAVREQMEARFEAFGPSGDAGARQGARRCPRLGAACYRKRRGRQRYSLPAHGLRAGGRGGPRHRRGCRAAAAGRLCGYLPLQLPADGALLVLAVCRRLRQYLHHQAFRAGAHQHAAHLRDARRMRDSRRASSICSTAPETP